ncbi:hypothetical protein V492_05601 [Pseudogymnoascus sp. VKM F-4246]|nr:hypothetical protein V492_05601 [Pseudogymnoascus sp. VKM F-4246]
MANPALLLLLETTEPSQANPTGESRGRTFAIDRRRNRTTWKLKSTVNHRKPYTRACLRWVAIRRHEYELLDERRRCRPQPQWRGLQPPQRPQYGREHARPERVHGHAHRQLCRPVPVPEPADTADAEWRHAKRLPILQQPRLSNESCSAIKTTAAEGR